MKVKMNCVMLRFKYFSSTFSVICIYFIISKIEKSVCVVKCTTKTFTDREQKSLGYTK